MNNFWKNLKEPFFVLAPMADVTDPAFRRMFSKYGKPDVTFTEFVAADGLMSVGKERLLKDLIYSEDERPIVAQIFGSKPENVEGAVKIIRELGFDGVDINMGCPDRNVEKQGAGSSLIKNPKLAVEIIEAAKRGAKMGEIDGIPVSVKTRVGYNTVELETWVPEILKAKPSALTIHARTRKEMSLVPARWEHIARVCELSKNSGVKIIGNGDVASISDGIKKAKETGANGVMVGRGVFGNPWFFNREISINDITIEKRLNAMLEHTKLFLELSGEFKNFAVMKKHYKAYVLGFDHAKDLRIKLMEADDYETIEKLVFDFIENHKEVVLKTPREMEV